MSLIDATGADQMGALPPYPRDSFSQKKISA